MRTGMRLVTCLAMTMVAIAGTTTAVQANAAAKVFEVTDADFKAEVLDSALPVAVLFSADWCGPCKQMTPPYEKVSEQYQGILKFARLNVDDSPQTPADYDVQSIPTVILFEDGYVLTRHSGALGEQGLQGWLGAYFGVDLSTATPTPTPRC